MYKHLITIDVDHKTCQYHLLTMEMALYQLYKLDLRVLHVYCCSLKMVVAANQLAFHLNMCLLALCSLPTISILGHNHQYSSLHF